MFKLDPNKCNSKTSEQTLMNYINGCLRNDEGNPGGEKISCSSLEPAQNLNIFSAVGATVTICSRPL